MRPRIAVTHPLLLPGGGSEVCAMWTVQALAADHDVTLITMGRPDLPALDRGCGTSTASLGIEVRTLPVPWGLGRRFDALRSVRLDRYGRRHAGEFDLMISAYNPMDFGIPGLQYVADFSFDDALRREVHAESGGASGVLYADSPVRAAYIALARALSGRTKDGWKRNRTLAVSAWVQGRLRDRFDVPSSVLYPPVSVLPGNVPWEDREDGFVVIGRLVPEKGLPQVIDILAEVRKVRPVHLHILGRPVRASYARELERLCRAHDGWVRFEGQMYGRDRDALLARHKYGLSGCRGESFGLAVAEMVLSGAIVWVPDGGGQTEIAAEDALVYRDRAEAAAKILAVLADPARQAELRARLAARAAAFSAPRFVSGLQAIVGEALSKETGHGV